MRVDHHNFYSEDGGREAVVFEFANMPGVWYVDLKENNQLVETRKMETDGVLHNEQYAENCAENWVLNVF